MKYFSLYIHFPYCEKKCPYCDFNSHTQTRDFDADGFQRAYSKELNWLKQNTDYQTVTSIFFGGGTPSLMPPDLCAEILQQIKGLWQIPNQCEITLEANPSSTEMQKLKSFQQAGINRVSLGVQSFNDDKLKFLGRVHDAKTALSALDIIADIFPKFSFDLIYACKNESLQQWQTELHQAIQFQPAHLSCYQLTIEPNTHFYKMARAGNLTLPENAHFMTETINYLSAHDLPPYEISNYAKQGNQSQHNLNYWRAGDYGGIGPGAHSRISINNIRHHAETIKNPDLWLQTLQKEPKKKLGTFADIFPLSQTDNALEKLLMGLRLREGVQLSDEEFTILINQQNLPDMQEFITHTPPYHLNLTDKGWLFLNHILERITKDNLFD